MRKVYTYGGIMIVMALISLISGAMAGKYAASASSGLACNLRKGIYDKVQAFSFSKVDKFSTAGLVTRMTTDVTNIQNAYQMCIRVAVRAPLMLVCSMAMSFMISPQISMFFLGAILFLACILGVIMMAARKIFDVVFTKYDDLNAGVQENVSGIRVVKAYVREDYENQKFTRAAENLCRLFVKAEGTLAFNNPAMMLVVYGCILAVSWFGARFIVIGTMSSGELTSLFSYIMSSMMSLMMLSMIFVMITMSAASIRRIEEIFKEEPGIRSPELPAMDVADGSVDFNSVCFSYGMGKEDAGGMDKGRDKGRARQALSDIELHIRSGETIGIIGGTGSGKSSLVNLISRLYDVDSGSVYVGGRDVREYDLETLRDSVAVVLQKNVLFSGTILENLRWGNQDATEEECRAACRAVCADEFIERFPDGYHTLLERGGANVSGGQKQRLCIARALLKNPRILILDDSTSAVDTATDARIREAFAAAILGITKIIIAQRISSVQHADHILVMEDGRINGYGTHDQLVRSNEIYREIYESQSRGGGDFDQVRTQNSGKESVA
ncbi:ATP-binding cassette, subfamily B [Enterocloster clostridioformis]|uniref:ATP-binding cassette, subfamily B n=1 Tax=Enterocloster clostridioformis TaxID=1531 RepID=A0A1I0I3K0_9FIRM|nr:ATP-binding cassette, subfamily B [Enterocloster clostridioformis]SEW37605.1 ATP-binding cassette, subfamily B [Enterocloster clostridioformis]